MHARPANFDEARYCSRKQAIGHAKSLGLGANAVESVRVLGTLLFRIKGKDGKFVSFTELRKHMPPQKKPIDLLARPYRAGFHTNRNG